MVSYLAAQQDDELRKDIRWNIAMKRGVLKAMPEGPETGLTEWAERRKAQVRAIVEHPFHVIKNLFGYRKVSYRGLAKNHARALVHAALVNLVLAKCKLLDGQICLQTGS